MEATVELWDGRPVLILYQSDKMVTCIRPPDGAMVGDSVTGIAEPDEGPYTVIDDPRFGHCQRLIETWLIHPGKSVSQALDEMGLDEESLIPRY